MSSDSKNYYSVVIVGAGPTGLTLANLLGRLGVHVLLVERNRATVSEPRAVSIDDESLRTMQATGLSGVILSQIVAGYGSEYYTRKGRLFLRVEPTEQPYGYPRRNAFRQAILEAQLRTGLGRFTNVSQLFSWSVREYSQTPDRVRVMLKGADDAQRTVECDFLIGCDGAASTVRTGLGVKLLGKTFAERWLIVDLDNSPAISRHTQVFCNAQRPCIALPGPNRTRRYEFKLHAHESAEHMLQSAVVAELLAQHGAAPESTLTRKVVYTFHARLAERWSSGRVFLAGDAAHLTPPFAGQGMNSGIRDAHNLAWKLAAVLRGNLGSGLLDSYELERRGHVAEMIRLALTMGRVMGPSGPVTEWLTHTTFRALSVLPRLRDYFAQMNFKPQPRFRRGFLIEDGVNERGTLIGRLLPQPLVIHADGTQLLLDEALGSGFALLCRAEDSVALANFLLHPTWSALDARRVALTSANAATETLGQIDVVRDIAGALLARLVSYRGQVLLVRPDRYVAASFDLSAPAAAAERLQALIASTWRPATGAASSIGGEMATPGAIVMGRRAG